MTLTLPPASSTLFLEAASISPVDATIGSSPFHVSIALPSLHMAKDLFSTQPQLSDVWA